MAIIQCPECGAEASDSAPACPNCGYGIREHFERIYTEQLRAKNKSRELTLGMVFMIVLSLGCCWFAVMGPKGDGNADSSEPQKSAPDRPAQPSETPRACSTPPPCIMGEKADSYVVTAVSVQALDEYAKRLARASREGTAPAMATNDLYATNQVALERAQSLTVVERALTKTKVRLEGGAVVWVLSENVVGN